MLTTPVSVPVLLRSDPGAGEQPLEILSAESIDDVLRPAVESTLAWFDSEALVGRYELESHRRALCVEMCHVMRSLGKTVALCAAYCGAKPVQELLIKCAFHFHRVSSSWDKIATAISGRQVDELDPLTSTLLLNLSLEELAREDPLAFSYAVDLFAPPGSQASADAVMRFFTSSLKPQDPANTYLQEWHGCTLGNFVSFASVPTTQRYGFPHTGRYGEACARQMGPMLRRDVDRSLQQLTLISDQLHLFYRGAQLFYVEKESEFPNLRENWLEV